MAQTDPRVDAYILKSAEFAQPVLNHLRSLIHKACPEVKETIKWSFPNFDYAGSILCSMAAFKQHCSFSFWRGSLMSDPHKLLLTGDDKTSMGHLGQIKSMKDLPPDKIFIEYIKEAMTLHEQGIKVKKEKAPPKPLEIPGYFLTALRKNKMALDNFEKFSPSQKKEYAEWITEAKTEATQQKRLATALEWIEEGKTRHWKYKNC